MTKRKLYVFPVFSQGAQRRLFFEGPVGREAHDQLCQAAKTLRGLSEQGMQIPALVIEAVAILTPFGFTQSWH